MTQHDSDKIVALLKSVATPCETKGGPDHSWRKCRHCLAVQELDLKDIRELLSAFLAAYALGEQATRAKLDDLITYADQVTDQRDFEKRRAEQAEALNGQATRSQLETERDQLRAALIGLVGASDSTELEQMEMALRSMRAPMADKASMIDAIHALIASAALRSSVKGAE